MTNDLIRRIYQHKNNLIEGFTNKYNLHSLVYYEQTGSVESEIMREKQIKKWNRQWKINLIEKKNPGWDDLYDVLINSQRQKDPRLRGDDRVEETEGSPPARG